MKSPLEYVQNTWQIIAGPSRSDLDKSAPVVSLQTLEDRVLYDASPLAAYAVNINEAIDSLDGLDDSLLEIANFDSLVDVNPVPTYDDFDDLLIGQSSNESVSQTARQLVIIDGRIDEVESLIDGISANGQLDIGFDVALLDQYSSGIDQITALLDGRHRYDAIHIVSHGSDGRLQLGNALLSSDNIGEYQSQLSSWTTGLAFGADILLYGCDVAKTGAGENFVDQFSELVGADMAASDDLTGHVSLGGDWNFEYSIGLVATDVAFSVDVQQNWQSILAAPVLSVIEAANIAYTENDAATQITNTISIADLDDTNIESAIVQITGNFTNGQDVLTFVDSGPITGVWNAALGTLTLTGSDTLANYEAALRSISYENTSENPSALTRTVSFVVNDGDVDSNTQTRDVDVTPVNDAPTDIAPNSFAVNENTDTTAGFSVGMLTSTDEDLGETFTYSIFGGTDAANFTIGGGSLDELILNDGILDFETKASYDVMVRVTDSAGNTYDENLTVNVNDLNDAPTDLLPNAVAVDENTDTTGGLSVSTLSATDQDAGDTFTYSIVGGADAANFSIGGVSSDELILDDGVLDFETKSSYSVIVRATDSGGLTYDEVLTVDINDLNESPVINHQVFAVDENATNGTSVGFAVSSDVDAGDSLTYTIIGGTGSTAFAINPANGEITVADILQLDFESTPSFTLTVEVTDTGGLKDTATITINLNVINDEQVISTNWPLSVNEGAGGIITTALLETTDQDHGPASLTYTVVTAPINGTLLVNGISSLVFTQDDIDSGRVSYQHNGNETTIDSFDFNVDDGVGSGSLGTFVIAINPVNDAPVANDDGIILNEGGTYIGSGADTLGNDTDAEFDPLTANLVTGPANGTLVLNADGSFTYTHDGSETTTDSFQYRANDGSLNTNVATVTITIVPVNDAPMGNTETYSVVAGLALNELVGVLANDTDAEFDAITAILASSPANGTILLNADGSFTYTPNAGLFGSDSFSYLPNDGNLFGNLTTVNIDVVAGAPPTPGPVDPSGPTVDPPVIETVDSDPPLEDSVDDTVDDPGTPLAHLIANAIPESKRYFTGGESNRFESEEAERYLDLLTDRVRATTVLQMILTNTSPDMMLDEDDLRRLRLSSGIGVAFDAKYLWQQLDELAHPDSILDDFNMTVGAITSIGTLGYVLWTLRGGALMALALSQFPSWRMIDPLLVLESYSMKKDGDPEDADGDFFGDAFASLKASVLS